MTARPIVEGTEPLNIERALPIPAPPIVAAVIPAYRAAGSIGAVLAAIGPSVDHVYVVDDGCPEASGAAADRCRDERLTVLRKPTNGGVGSAMKLGYAAALAGGAEIVVKLDADGQMNPVFIPRLLAPILAGQADYAKGNRFALRHRVPAGTGGATDRPMPRVRRLGNNLLSFLHKGVTGYWNIVDPTNGYTAIHRRALESIALDEVADCYFFETDMLFQLNLAGAVVEDVPLPARYAGEISSLRLRGVLGRFPALALRRVLRRILVRYFLDDFNVASLQMLVGLPLLLFGAGLGLYHWLHALDSGVASTPGTVMFAALPIIIGFQLLLSAVSYDVANRPVTPISRPPGEDGSGRR